MLYGLQGLLGFFYCHGHLQSEAEALLSSEKGPLIKIVFSRVMPCTRFGVKFSMGIQLGVCKRETSAASKGFTGKAS